MKHKRRRDSFNDDDRNSRTHKKHNSSKVFFFNLQVFDTILEAKMGVNPFGFYNLT